MFEVATRKKIRFHSPKGQLTVEDVWDLPLRGKQFSLDTLAKDLHREIKNQEEESFVVKQSSASADLKLRFDIVKHVIEVKLEEEEARSNERKDRERRQKIMEAISRKKDEDLHNKSVEELEALLNQ